MFKLSKRIFMIISNENDYEVDCEWSPWKSWSGCTKSCGGGSRRKNRLKSVTEAYGGTCEGNATETKFCNEQDCPGKISAHLYSKSCSYILSVLYTT